MEIIERSNTSVTDNGEGRVRKNTAIMYVFRFTLKYDGGYVRIVATGGSPQAARRKVILSEGCPLSAIVREEIQDGKRFVNFM